VNQIRRIESGILSWGVDMTAEENPYELGLGRLVQLERVGNCVGRDALLKLAEEPLTRKLVGMILNGNPLAGNETVWPLSIEHDTVGKLTSLAYSPRLEANIALGLVRADLTEPGTEFYVNTWNGPRTATVTPLPFVTKKQAADAATLLQSARDEKASRVAGTTA